MADKIYVGNGKAFSTQYGEIINVSVCLTDIQDKAVDFLKIPDNGKKYIGLQIMKRREPDRYNNTHTVIVDTYKKDSQNKEDLGF